MKNLRVILAIVLFATFSFAQDVKKDDWIRVQSDDGEFSIEVPAKYGYFYDKDGTSIGDSSGSYGIYEMSVLNSYKEHTLISFESYRASKDALKAIQRSNENGMSWQKLSFSSSEIKLDNFKIKQLISKNDKQYTVRRYFYSKKYIYVLTASSRLGETPVMKRFFESLSFKPDANTKLISNETRFSGLKATQIDYEENVEKQNKDDKRSTSTLAAESDPTVKPLIILNMPLATFTDSARDASINGEIRLKVTFSEFGQITKIVVLKHLDKGLMRNAALAALRIKVIPQEKDDKPIPATKTIEYRFSIG
jgi:hypothetical protein